MRRAALIAIAVLSLVGCKLRHVEREVVTIDGQKFLCSKSVNQWSGNEGDPQCVRVEP